MRFDLPDGASGYDACVFSQRGIFVMVGHREECEQTALSMGALYCWIYRGRVIVRQNFELTQVNNEID